MSGRKYLKCSLRIISNIRETTANKNTIVGKKRMLYLNEDIVKLIVKEEQFDDSGALLAGDQAFKISFCITQTTEKRRKSGAAQRRSKIRWSFVTFSCKRNLFRSGQFPLAIWIMGFG